MIVLLLVIQLLTGEVRTVTYEASSMEACQEAVADLYGNPPPQVMGFSASCHKVTLAKPV